jgi:hypothetical protein
MINDSIKMLNSLPIEHHRRAWRGFMEKYGCKRIAEVGVFRGENFMRMIEHNPEVAVAVDTWSIDAANDAKLSQDQLNEQYECFRAMTINKPFVQIRRGKSIDIAKEYEDNYFDLIYIDGDHSYQGCKEDIIAWLPKTKRFLVGDDYNKPGVNKAVNELLINITSLPRHGWAIIK